MIAPRRLQRKFADGLIAEAIEDLWPIFYTLRRKVAVTC